MATSVLMQSIKEARRDALVSNYIAQYVPSDLRDNITNSDDLYEYLLLDTKISDLVQTSPISEAISSVQLYINRCIEGYEGNLTEESNSFFANGKFLYNWDLFNKRYSTWAGKERLKYYAGSFIDPSLRYGKTEQFQSFEQGISQGRLTEDIVSSSLRDYLTGYEVLTNLDCISVNKGEDESILFFIGRSSTTPFEYYWRKLILKSDTDGTLVPNKWAEWKSLSVSISDAQNNMVVPYWYNNRLHVQWISTETVQKNNASEEQTYLNDWVLNSSGVWRTFRKLETTTQDAFSITDEGSADRNYLTVSTDQLSYTVPNDFSVSLTAGTISGVTLSFTATNSNYRARVGSFEARPAPYSYALRINQGTAHKIEIIGANSQVIVQFSFVYNGPPNRDLQNGFGVIINNQYTPPSDSSIEGPINLGANVDIDLGHLLEIGLESLFDYSVQGVDQLGGLSAFYGPFGLYYWEILFHIPFLAATRFQTERRFELAEKWLRFIFNSTGYRDEDGNLIKDEAGNVRYWNVVPLQEDTEWDDTMSLATVDPDEIAMADPMQYKLAIFLHSLDFQISRGDHYYRMLSRESLTEAKMYYMQAFQLLGPRPEIRINDSWPDPTLANEADAIIVEPTSGSQNVTPILSLRALLQSVNGNFLPPYNEDLLAFWDKIDLRLYNLRHNLSLDGLPLSLPLFAEPVTPTEIQKSFGVGDGVEQIINSELSSYKVYRFPTLVDKARTAVGSVIQFGNALQTALEKQDAESMTLLLQMQQQIVLQQMRDIQEKNLDVIQANIEATQAAKEGAEHRKNEYQGLLDNWISANETSALSIRTTSRILNISSSLPLTISGALNLAPNIFGLANGGMDFGSAVNAAAQVLQVNATAQDQSAEIMDISESYRRRREDWQLQHDIAENDVKQLDFQILSLQEQLAMAQKQLTLAETEHAQALIVYEMQRTRFTSQALYNWITGRLSTLYFQLYDLTLPVCFMAKSALERELGSDKTIGVFSTPSWNDLYQGLLAGEILLAEVQKLDTLWLEENMRGLEAIKTVSLQNIIQEQNQENTFAGMLQELLSGTTPEGINGVSIKIENNIFIATLDLSQIGLDSSYNQSEKVRKIKNLSVTLPTLLGPYQDIEATLSLGTEVVALSHGMNDSGLFVTDFNDSRFLPFEGMDPTTGMLVLSIFQAEQDGSQRALLENLNDIIFHIRYIIR